MSEITKKALPADSLDDMSLSNIIDSLSNDQDFTISVNQLLLIILKDYIQFKSQIVNFADKSSTKSDLLNNDFMSAMGKFDYVDKISEHLLRTISQGVDELSKRVDRLEGNVK